MLNWLRTLTESDKRRLRRLERVTDDLAADVTLLTERVVRSEARQRARARRALEREPGDSELRPGDDVDSGGVDSAAVLQPEQLSAAERDGDRSTIRESLRARARAKFGRLG